MKRAFSLALTALLLAGCTAAPAASGEAAASAEPAPSPAAAENTEATATASTEPLRKMQNGDEAQYYTQQSTPSGLLVYHVVDLTTGENTIPCDVEGCTHDTADCPAVTDELPSAQPLVLDENTVVIFSWAGEVSGLAPSGEASNITLADRQCHDRRLLASIPGTHLELNNGVFTDGQALYVSGWEGGGVSFYRIQLADGRVDKLGQNQPAAYLVGAMDRELVYCYTAPSSSTGESAAYGLSAGATVHNLLNVDTGAVRELYTYPSDDNAVNYGDAAVIDGQYYLPDRTAGTLSTLDPATGESRQITDQLPTTEPGTYANYRPQAVLDGWMVFYDLPVIVNVETGEVRQRIDLPENYWNGYGHQPSIFLQLKDRLLVDCRYEPYTRTDPGTDGTPVSTKTERMYLGLISIEDFLNGVPNYTEVCEGPY